MKANKRLISILITVIILTSITSFMPFMPRVKADLSGPRTIYGYITHSSNDTGVPSGTTVSLLDLNTSYSNTTTTSESTGLYFFTVQNGVDGGNIMVINCTWYNGTAATWEHGSGACNLSTSGAADNVSFTIAVQNLSISINDTSWNAGTINYTSYNATSDTYFNITNQGNTKINVRVHGENITWNGNKWNLTSTPALNNFTLQYAKNGSSWQAISYTNSTFRENLYPNNGGQWWFYYKIWTYGCWQQFGLNITMPTSSSPSPTGSLEVNVTFWSIMA